MSQQRYDLNVEAREAGKSISRALRMGRRVPAVLYGAGANGVFNVSIDESSIVRYNTRAYENTLFNLKSSDSKVNNVVVLMKDVNVHPVTRRPQHVDLLAIDLKKTVKVFIEVRLEGKPLGLAEGGLLNVVNRQIEIECLPTEIPDAFTADISHLGVGDALHISDLKLPAGIKVMSPLDMTIAVVNLYVEETAAPAAAAAADPAAATAAAPAAAGKAAPAAGKDAPAKKEDKK